MYAIQGYIDVYETHPALCGNKANIPQHSLNKSVGQHSDIDYSYTI